MKYMIVEYDFDKMEWIILHYSHSWDDTEKQVERLRKLYPECEIMINYEEVRTEEQKKIVKNFMEGFLNAITKRLQVSTESSGSTPF